MTAAIELISVLGGGAVLGGGIKWLLEWVSKSRRESIGDVDKGRESVLALMREQIASGDRRAEVAATRAEVLTRALIENAHANQAVTETLKDQSEELRALRAESATLRQENYILTQEIIELLATVRRVSSLPPKPERTPPL